MSVGRIEEFPLWPGTAAPDLVSITMPAQAQILAVSCKNTGPCVSALVDPQQPPEQRWFRLAVAGDAVEGEGMQFLGTFQFRDASLVFLVFEQID